MNSATKEPAILYQPFAPRKRVFLGITEFSSWRFKAYSISHQEPPVEVARFREGASLVFEMLPPPKPEAGRPGVGILIFHAGRGADYAVLCWWDRENELPIRVALRDQSENALWRMAGVSESICVWDLELISQERDAYVTTVLGGRDIVAGVEDYLESIQVFPCAQSPAISSQFQ